MPIRNLSELRAAHDKFLMRHSLMVREVLHEGVDVAHAEIYQHPVFRPVTHKVQDDTKIAVVRTHGGSLLRISNRNKRARWLEEGTQPHWIFPHKKKVLRFRTPNGFWVSKKFVKHPGTKPYWFMRSARNAASIRIDAGLKHGMSRIARDFGR